jgi:DnaJ-class molecular chaperone
MNPYLVLGVSLEADDRVIRQAYLDAIRVATPEHDPRRFQALTAAYHEIKDEPSRHRYTLFNTTAPGQSPLEAFLSAAALLPTLHPPAFDTLKEILRSCAKK